jgi:hypothetical protein
MLVEKSESGLPVGRVAVRGHDSTFPPIAARLIHTKFGVPIDFDSEAIAHQMLDVVWCWIAESTSHGSRVAAGATSVHVEAGPETLPPSEHY